MSLAIDVDKVAEVLLPDGEWYKVANGSFNLDSYEYIWDTSGEKGGVFENSFMTVFGGGNSKEVIAATGASWRDVESRMYFCPLNSVLAVKYSAVPS